jgi:hypothetical protein
MGELADVLLKPAVDHIELHDSTEDSEQGFVIEVREGDKTKMTCKPRRDPDTDDSGWQHGADEGVTQELTEGVVLEVVPSALVQQLA